VHVVFDTACNDLERNNAADVGKTPLAEVSYLMANSFDDHFVCVLRPCQFEWIHINNIHVSEIGK